MPTSRKVGRRLLGHTITSEQRRSIHRWFNTPKNQREPRTVQEFADQLGIHRNMLYYLRRQPVDGLPNKYWGGPLECDSRLLQATALLPKSNKISTVRTKPVGTQTAAKPVEPRPQVVPPVRRVWRSEHEIDTDMLMNAEERYQAHKEFAQYPKWAKQYKSECANHEPKCDCIFCHIQRIVGSQNLFGCSINEL